MCVCVEEDGMGLLLRFVCGKGYRRGMARILLKLGLW